MRASANKPVDDPTIEEATVMGNRTVRRGDQVKHYGQRSPGLTATVVGFRNVSDNGRPRFKVLIEALPGRTNDYCRRPEWDADRTVAAR